MDATKKRLDEADGLVQRAYLKSVVVLLSVTCIAKLIMVSGSAAVLNEPSPLFTFVSNRDLVIFSALLELAVVVLTARRGVTDAASVLSFAWLALAYSAYRMTLWISGFTGYCDCLGSISDSMGMNPEQANWLAKGILFYILAGSCLILLKRRLSRLTKKREASGGLPNVAAS